VTTTHEPRSTTDDAPPGDPPRPLMSICVPAYNRPEALGELLESIATQSEDDYEILIHEDASPERISIRATVADFTSTHPSVPTRYIENPVNLGYDGNLRALVHAARGLYCVFMGNDDLVAPGALTILAAALRSYPETRVVLRTYATFDTQGHQIVHRYFAGTRYFPPGSDSLVTFFRRSIVISGMSVHRDSAAALETDRFDGSLLYQLYVVGMLMATGPGLSLPQPLALYRLGGSPDFGVSRAESAYTPGLITPESSLAFVSGLLQIARYVASETRLPVFRPILFDVGDYSYPLFRYHAAAPLKQYLRYAWGLMKLGLWHSPFAWAYAIALGVLGPTRSDRAIEWVRSKRESTPRLGRFSSGRPIPEGSITKSDTASGP
jgi:O-antigen biosynthesis alpha-1,2-rahmnosyltransferase